ncbi:MAG: DUF4261 domain-containing protein [Thermodesulfovibrionales bacterium]|nr:DUF4261 domain-containing protein [Thermodesulfovibrionales bacterium]
MLKDNVLPLPVWIKVTGYRKDNGNLYLYTLGMKNFNHREMEIMDYRGNFSDGYFFMLELANYLMTRGPVIKDGDTVGYSEIEKIKIKFKKSELDEDEEVMSILF